MNMQYYYSSPFTFHGQPSFERLGSVACAYVYDAYVCQHVSVDEHELINDSVYVYTHAKMMIFKHHASTTVRLK